MAATKEMETQAPLKLGDRVWYRMSRGFYGEWVPAVVVDRSEVVLPGHLGGGTRVDIFDLPRSLGNAHLEITTDPVRHCCPGTRAWRQDRSEGTGYGQWQREKPATADADYQQAVQVAAMKKKLFLERVREEAGLPPLDC